MSKKQSKSKSKYSKRKNPYDLSKWHARDVINARLEELGKTTYWLVSKAGSSEAVVYRFLAEDSNVETTFSNVCAMLKAVGLEISVSVSGSSDN